MDKKYWDRFYNREHTFLPTSFVRRCVQWLKQNVPEYIGHVYDLGCGNGRDTSYWATYSIYSVTGVDQSVEGTKGAKWEIIQTNIFKFLKGNKTKKDDIVYSRFFLHVLSKREIKKVIKWTQGYFMAEFRLKGDKPTLYTNHRRKFVDGSWLLSELVKQGYDILYYTQGRGLAPYKTEDPLVGRVIARRKTS